MEEKQKSMRIAADIVRAAPNPATWMYPPFRSIMSIFMDKVSQVEDFPREVKDENGELIGVEHSPKSCCVITLNTLFEFMGIYYKNRFRDRSAEALTVAHIEAICANTINLHPEIGTTIRAIANGDENPAIYTHEQYKAICDVVYQEAEAITHLSIDTFFDWIVEEEVTNNGE